MDIAFTPSAAALIFTTIFVGVTTPIKTYIGFSGNPNFGNPMWEKSENRKTTKKQINLKDPIGVFGIQHDLNKNIRLFAEHQSSVPEKYDGLGFNHAGVKFLLSVDKRSKVYAGLSVHHPGLDSKRTKINNPIVILGGESGGTDVKVFGEYITAADDFENGRFGMGIKYVFN